MYSYIIISDDLDNISIENLYGYLHDVFAHSGIKVICKTVHTIFSGEMGL